MSYENIKVTLVEQGDVLQADGSWCIVKMPADNHKKLVIHQSFRDAADPDAPLVASEGGYDGYRQTHDYVVDTDGPAATDCSSIRVNGEFMTLAEIAADEGISVKGKNFLVTEVEKQDKMSGHSEGDRIVTARELTDKFELAPGGLTVEFEQRAYPGPQALCDVNIIGRRKPTFGPFEPK